MARGPLRFRQSDICRALKAAIAAGVQVERVRIGQDGEITIEVKDASAETDAERDGNPWDKALAS